MCLKSKTEGRMPQNFITYLYDKAFEYSFDNFRIKGLCLAG